MQHYATHVDSLKPTAAGSVLGINRVLVVLASDAEAAITAAEQCIFAIHPEWTVTGMCEPDCLPCRRLTELITEREAGHAEGERDMLARCREALAGVKFYTLADAARADAALRGLGGSE